MNLEFEEIVSSLIEEYSRSAMPEVDSSRASDEATVGDIKTSLDNSTIFVDADSAGSHVKDSRNRRDEALPVDDFWTEERRRKAELELRGQGEGVSRFWREHYISRASKFWHEFYKRNADRFYKDRHYLHEEFPELLDCSVLLEVGCGVGNAVVPLFELNDRLNVYAIDCARSAIEILQQHPIQERFIDGKQHLYASVCDVINDPLPTSVGQCDLVLCLFVLSAMAPESMPLVMKKLYDTLRPGGRILVRDYGQYDEAQMRFKKGSKLSDNFYVRQDSTCSYFFSLEYLEQLCRGAGFRQVPGRVENITKTQENRAQQKSRHRVWVQGVYEK